VQGIGTCIGIGIGAGEQEKIGVHTGIRICVGTNIGISLQV